LSNEPLLCEFVDEVDDLPSSEPSADLRNFISNRLKSSSLPHSFSTRRVLIFTNKLDVEADLVGIGLLRRGIDYLRLDIDDIPDQHLLIKYFLEDERASNLELTTGADDSHDLAKIKVVWLRHFDTKEINFGGTEFSNIFAFQQWNDALLTLQNNLASSEWIDRPDATLLAENRFEQLSVAKKVGFSIPATLITNDPLAAREFYSDHDGDIVLKTLHHHGILIKDKRYSIYTRPFLNHDTSKLNGLIHAPCILQERLHKRSELRVTVVGKQAFAVEIDSQSTIDGKDDWHRSDILSLPKRVVGLEHSISELCVKLINSLGLKYGAIDLVNTKADDLVFLEVNPTGDWYWIERSTGLRISECVVDMIEKFTHYD
jgi:glutathione synthase/RimK-type ligase-like ATP-grasp enzyme